MTSRRAPAVADALLYEGYALYPYRPSSLKDREPSFFGLLRAREDARRRDAAERWAAWAECLVAGDEGTELRARLRFLRDRVPEPVEADLCASVGQLLAGEVSHVSATGSIQALVSLSAERAAAGAWRIRVRVANDTAVGDDLDQDAVRARSMLSVQVILEARGGSFATPRSAPADLEGVAQACASDGLWPILLDPATVLLSPIVVEDRPALAPEMAVDPFDATEIDEILALRVRTLAPAEVHEIEHGDGRVRDMVRRMAALTDDEMLRLHGALRGRTPLAAGARVRLRPRGRADIFDLTLDGRAATVVSLEQDAEGRSYCTVVLDDDPGRDLGFGGRPGHRFFFSLEEIEPLADQ